MAPSFHAQIFRPELQGYGVHCGDQNALYWISKPWQSSAAPGGLPSPEDDLRQRQVAVGGREGAKPPTKILLKLLILM